MVGTYSFKEELINAITHWLGFLLGIFGLVVLVLKGVKNESILQIVGFSIYGGCLIYMYLSSAIYHSIPNLTAKKILRIFDHCSIFVFIGGTYTPIILLSLENKARIFALALIWSICLIGIVFKIAIKGKYGNFKKLSLAIYLGLGWISVFMLRAIIKTTSLKFIFFLVLGGILYSVGSYFYSNKNIKNNHAIWHIFVLMASISHFIGILTAYAM